MHLTFLQVVPIGCGCWCFAFWILMARSEENLHGFPLGEKLVPWHSCKSWRLHMQVSQVPWLQVPVHIYSGSRQPRVPLLLERAAAQVPAAGCGTAFLLLQSCLGLRLCCVFSTPAVILLGLPENGRIKGVLCKPSEPCLKLGLKCLRCCGRAEMCVPPEGCSPAVLLPLAPQPA